MLVALVNALKDAPPLVKAGEFVVAGGGAVLVGGAAVSIGHLPPVPADPPAWFYLMWLVVAAGVLVLVYGLWGVVAWVLRQSGRSVQFVRAKADLMPRVRLVVEPRIRSTNPPMTASAPEGSFGLHGIPKEATAVVPSPTPPALDPIQTCQGQDGQLIRDGDTTTLLLQHGSSERVATGTVRAFEQDGDIRWEVSTNDPQHPAIGFLPEQVVKRIDGTTPTPNIDREVARIPPPQQTVSVSPPRTFETEATIYALLREQARVTQEAKQYRDDDPTLGLAYKCPHCGFRTYTDRGAGSMLTHISESHETEANPTGDTEDQGEPQGLEPPVFQGVPPDVRSGHVETMCGERAGLLASGQSLLASLWNLPVNATTEDYRSHKGTWNVWRGKVDAYGLRWWKQQGNGITKEGAHMNAEPRPTLAPPWRGDTIKSVKDRLAWLEKYGADQCP
jgi:hypothetical protein